MKTLITSLAFLSLGTSLLAQGSLIVFSENGERFSLYVNGQQVSVTPGTNARFDGINTEFVQTRVVFEEPAFGEFNKGVMVAPTKEVTYAIRQNNKGKWTYRYVSEAPAGSTAPAVTRTPVDGDGSMNQGNMGGSMNGNVQGGSTTTTTTTGGNQGNGSVAISFGVNANDNGMGMGVNMNVNDGMGNGNVNMSSTTTTTTTTSGGNMGHMGNQDDGWDEMDDNQGSASSGSGRYEMAERDIFCVNGMWDNEYRQGVATIKDQSFEEEMLNSAKRMADSKCFSLAQVKGVMELFTYDETKLNFAIYVYRRVGKSERENYYTLTSNFTFSKTKSEFDEFLKWARTNIND